MIAFTVPGPPQGKARARTVRSGAYVHSYTPAKTAQYEALVRQMCKAAGAAAADGPVQAVIRAYYPIPKSWSRAKRQQAMAGRIPVQVKPDLDNVVKIIMDALNGTAWADDKQVTWLQSCKQYGEPRVEVEIWQA